MNGLRGIGFEVTLIGERTNGKNVGMNVFEWRDLEGYDYEFAPITFQGYNAEMRTVDPAGIEPDFAVSETESGWFEDFGPGEPAPAQGARTDRGGRSRTRPDTLRRSRRSRAERPRPQRLRPSVGHDRPPRHRPGGDRDGKRREGRVRQKTALTAQKFGE